MNNYTTSLELYKKWNIQNTGYTGNSISYDTIEKALSNTNTNGNNDFYAPPVKTSSITNTITYDTAQSTFETSTTTMRINYPYVTSTSTTRAPTATDDISTTSTSLQTYSVREETFDIRIRDVEIDTHINKEEYVSMTYRRKLGGEWKQGNYSYTDFYSYMLTEDFGGVSVSANEQTSTNWTSVSQFTYTYNNWGYSYTWSWTWTTTLTYSYSSYWHAFVTSFLESFDSLGNAYYSTTDLGWWDQSIVYYTRTDYWDYVWGNWWGYWTFAEAATRPDYLAGGGDLLVANYPTMTSNVNTYSKSYINKSTLQNRAIYLTLSGIQTLSKTDFFNPTNNTFSTSTFYNLGTMSVPIKSKTTTWELI